MRLMHGGANTEINLHRFIGTLTATLKTNLSPSNDTPAYQAFRKRILDALASKPADWYWGANGNVTPADATTEVATVTKNIDAVLTRMRMMNERRLGGLALLQAHSYSKVPNPPSLFDGAPGLVETSGLGSAALVPFVRRGQGRRRAAAGALEGRHPGRVDDRSHRIRQLGRHDQRLRPIAHLVAGGSRRRAEDRHPDECADSELPRQAAGGTVSVPDRRRGTRTRRNDLQDELRRLPRVARREDAQRDRVRRRHRSAARGRDSSVAVPLLSEGRPQHLPGVAAGVHVRRAGSGGRPGIRPRLRRVTAHRRLGGRALPAQRLGADAASAARPVASHERAIPARQRLVQPGGRRLGVGAGQGSASCVPAATRPSRCTIPGRQDMPRWVMAPRQSRWSRTAAARQCESPGPTAPADKAVVDDLIAYLLSL